MERRALLIADVVDSTTIVQRLGDAAATMLWTEHDRVARDLIAEHGGREIDRSDGFFLLFDDVAASASFAVGYHAALARLGLAARVGIHVGTVTLRHNPPDAVARGAKPLEVDGLAKPLAARVMTLADGGQTLLSAAAASALHTLVPSQHALCGHGHYRLKGIEDPLALFELVREGCSVVPPSDVEKAYRVVRDGEIWKPVREVRHNLARERDAFVGRRVELRQLAETLDRGERLVTVIGPGGTGKTRLVRRYGLAWLGEWPGGVYFCDLADASSVEGICFAVAAALEVPLGKADPVTHLGMVIAGRGRCLLLLDNFEQIVAHADATIGHWLDRACDACLVVTSRERLQLAGEVVFPIEPLDPETDAVDLFEIRARAHQPTFALDDVTRPPVRRIAELLDGLPLAIELAAARVRVLSPRQIVERLTDRFTILGGARGGTKRQATLRATIEWSWDLLAAFERAALAQCSTFEGGFTMEAAEAVVDLSSWSDAPPVIDVVQALVDKSLLRATHRPAGPRLALAEPYFGMYLSIHEFAAERLQALADGAAESARRRHGRYFASFGGKEAVRRRLTRGDVGERHALALEIDNLMAAHHRAVARRDADTAVPCLIAACSVLHRTGPHHLAAALGDSLFQTLDLTPELRISALLPHAWAQWLVGRFDLARDFLQEALRLERGAEDHVARARASFSLGVVCNRTNRPDEAAAYLDTALSLTRQHALRALEGSVLAALAHTSVLQGLPSQALHLFESALVVHREVGNHESEGIELSNVASIQIDHGQHRLARDSLRRAVELLRSAGLPVAEAVALGNLAQLTASHGSRAEALALTRRALATLIESGARVFVGPMQSNLGDLERIEGNLEAARGHLTAALSSAREVGDRRDEAMTLVMLGEVSRDAGGTEEARTLFEQAVGMAAEIHDERTEGKALARLATLEARKGRHAESRDLLQRSERLLRACGDTFELALMHCESAAAEEAMQDQVRSRSALVEAQRLADEMAVSPDSELARRIAALSAP